MTRYANDDQLRDMVRSRINYEMTQKMLAKEYGVSQGYLSDYLMGRRNAGPKILAALGYLTTPFYRKATPPSSVTAAAPADTPTPLPEEQR